MRAVQWFDERVWASILSQRRSIVKGLLCSGGSAALLGLTTWLINRTLFAVENKQEALLSSMALAVIGVYSVRYFLTRGQMFYLSRAANRLTADLRQQLFAKLQRLPVSYFNEKRAGAIQSVLTNDVSVYQSAVTSVRDAIDGPIKIVAGLAGIVIIQPVLSLSSLAVVPFMVYFIQRNARKMRGAQAQVQSDLSDLSAVTQEQLQGARIVKAFAAEQTVAQRYDQLVERSYESQMNAARRIASLKPMVELIGAVALAVTVFVCGQLVSRNQLTVHQLGSFIYALDVINQGFKSVGSLKQTMAQVRAAADRIHGEILDVPETMADRDGAVTLPTVEGRVEFHNVSFAYPDGTKALDNVSFTIEPGTSLALVGPSGAGKSTIADLLLRFYDPSEGTVLFDGHDVRTLQTQWYRSQFGVVPQQTFLFAGTVVDNLRLGAPNATEEQVRSATRQAHVDAFLDATPDGLETVLGERGVRLSGGEGQRLAIARALVRDPKVLLLDEATSNLDSVSEKVVTEALTEVMHTRTALFIAHRLSTAARADKILVLRKGQVVESGTHAELMAGGGLYASMVNAFAAGGFEDNVG